MVGLKVKSCITTTNLENTTLPSMLRWLNITKSWPKILMVLNSFCCKILCIYLFLRISVSKNYHIVINIFLVTCIQPGVVLKLYIIFLTIWAWLFLQNVFLLKNVSLTHMLLAWLLALILYISIHINFLCLNSLQQ